MLDRVMKCEENLHLPHSACLNEMKDILSFFEYFSSEYHISV